ncbi:hypothetical protein EDD91_2048 [Streptomyces sp. KS 21]|nr:hypothetical protein EDD91_2048 [Streptomyces sp. KS 21]
MARPQPEQAERCASCHSHTGHSNRPGVATPYSVGLPHSTQSAYGGPATRPAGAAGAGQYDSVPVGASTSSMPPSVLSPGAR